MARPIRNTVDYFPHIIGDGKKIFYIESKYGNDGYATWFKILEKLAVTENHYLNLNQEQDVLFLAATCRVDEKRLIEIINDLVKIGALNEKCWKKKIVWSDKFIENIQDAYKRRNNKCIHFDGLCKHLSSLGITITQLSPQENNNNTQSIVEYSKVEKVNRKKIFFRDSEYFDKDKFKKAMPSDWNKEKLSYYYESALAWSNEGNKKIDWEATIKNWARKDEKEGKLKFHNKSNSVYANQPVN